MIKVVFYKAEYGTFLDKLIAFYTCGKYSHCEIYFPSDDLCFSVSFRDKCTRFKKININNKKWDSIEIKINTKDVFREAVKINKRKYDWLGLIFTQIFPFNRQDKNKWFCSELCGYLLHIDKPYRFNPNSLYKYLENKLNI